MGLEMKSRALYRAFPNAMGYPHYSAGSGEPPWVFEGEWHDQIHVLLVALGRMNRLSRNKRDYRGLLQGRQKKVSVWACSVTQDGASPVLFGMVLDCPSPGG